MKEKLNKLNALFAEIIDLTHIQALLGWDQLVLMPPGGTEDRGNQAALIGGMIHERMTSDEVGKLITDLETEIGDLSADIDEARTVKRIKRLYEQQTKIPKELLIEFIKVTTAANNIWVKAKQDNDFASFQPSLEKIIELRREIANLFKPYDHIYDPLLDQFEPGMKTADVKKIFDELRPKQVELLEAISKSKQVDNSFLKQNYDQALQEKFGKHVITRFGYDWERGRLDIAPHPFTTEFSLGDVRITTRYLDDDGASALFSTMHEAGHGMYEQGLDKKYNRTALAGGTSLAIHESQSRLWEYLVGRSKEFWTFFYPTFQMLFPQYLGDINLDKFYKGINQVEPSPIRVEADEATYNLHIMLRLEIEIGLIEQSMDTKDLPQIWNSKMKEYLGFAPQNDSQGVLQDVHWSSGLVGYFSTYALGNLVSVQLWDKMLEENPNLPDEMMKGEFGTIHNWMREKVHQYGSKYDPQELVQKITGSKITPEPYLKYLNKKYSDIYNL
ncbi:MAG: carboxypeptidase M32 [Chloroflexota bacterium]